MVPVAFDVLVRGRFVGVCAEREGGGWVAGLGGGVREFFDSKREAVAYLRELDAVRQPTLLDVVG